MSSCQKEKSKSREKIIKYVNKENTHVCTVIVKQTSSAFNLTPSLFNPSQFLGPYNPGNPGNKNLVQKEKIKKFIDKIFDWLNRKKTFFDLEKKYLI